MRTAALKRAILNTESRFRHTSTVYTYACWDNANPSQKIPKKRSGTRFSWHASTAVCARISRKCRLAQAQVQIMRSVKHFMRSPGDVPTAIAYSASLGNLCRRAFLAAVPAKTRASLFTNHSGLIANLVYFKNPTIVARLGCPVGRDEVWLGHNQTQCCDTSSLCMPQYTSQCCGPATLPPPLTLWLLELVYLARMHV